MLFCFGSASASDFPYAQIQLRTPPQADPFPGLGNNYSALSGGIDTSMWNAASLAKVKHAEFSLSQISGQNGISFSGTIKTEDKSETRKLDNKDVMFFRLFMTGDPTVTTLATREQTGHATYQTNSVGTNFRQAMRVNDWLTLGLVSRSETGGTINASGLMPVIGDVYTNLLNNSFTFGKLALNINSLGNTVATITRSDGTTNTLTLDQPLWSGFTQQRSVVPASMILEGNNDLQINSDLTFQGAINWQNLAVGINLTPISASSTINNSIMAIVNPGTPDIQIFQPNANISSEADIFNWAMDPNLYATQTGYKLSSIPVPAGQALAEGKFNGIYQANAARFDLGTTYDFGDNFTIGLVLENIGGAKLDFKGSGRIAYLQSKISTAEPTNFTDPTLPLDWSPFNGTYTPVEGANPVLQELYTFEVPHKIRLGFALKKPLLFTLDYELNQTPINFSYKDDNQQERQVSVSNFSFLRFGTESQLFSLPAWLRSSLTLMLKPTLSNAAAKLQADLDNAFALGFLPVNGSLGAEAMVNNVSLGASLGINGSNLISILQLDTIDVDLSKLVYYNVFTKIGPWQVTYLASVDPGLSLATYKNRPAGAEFDQSMLKWIQTLSVSYKF